MFEVYSFLFYYMYKSIEKNDKLTPIWTTASWFALIQLFNLGVLVISIGMVFNYHILQTIGKSLFIGGFIVLMLINVIFVNNKKVFHKILNTYEDKSEDIHRKNWYITVAYIVVSFLLVFVIVIIKNYN